MLTSKQRAEFRAQANSLETTLMVGKDGVTEAVDKSGNEYSAQKLAHTVSAMFERSASEITREIIKSVERFTHKSEYLDDLTLLTIKRL